MQNVIKNIEQQCSVSNLIIGCLIILISSLSFQIIITSNKSSSIVTEEKIYKEEINLNYDELTNIFQKQIEELNRNLEEIKSSAYYLNQYFLKDKSDINNIKKLAIKYETIKSDIVNFNVGGTHFSILKSNIDNKIINPYYDNKENIFYDAHLLQTLTSGIVKVVYDDQKAIFIDRNPKYFVYILDFLRSMSNEPETYKIPITLNQNELNEFLEEAKYYQIDALIDIVNEIVAFDSIIISRKDRKNLFKLISFDIKKKLKRLYRASIDGFGAGDFHKKCDGFSNTLTIIKTTNNYIFGGYTSAAWDSLGNYKNDQNSFIFSLVNIQNKPIKINYKTHYGIYCGSSYGPTFGGGHDFHISDSSNTNFNSYSNLGHSYVTDFLNYDSNEAKSFLAGSHNFQVSEIEVFQEII